MSLPLSSAGGNLGNPGQVDASLLNNSAPNPIDGGNQWFPYFGEPNGELKLNVYDRYKHETYDLPEAYKGQCLYLRDTMDGLIVEGNDWYTTVALPWVQTEHMHIAWNEFHFNQTLAGRVPHEGVSRLISSSKRGHKEAVVRRGIAMVLEHGFMNTPEGQEQYRRNLIGIRTCVQETANHDVMQAYLTCKRYDREWEAKHGYHNLDLRRVLEHEVNAYMLVQKSPDGLDILIEQMRQSMGRYGVTPNMIIMPPGMSLHLTMVNPEQTEYWVAGPDGTKIKKQGPKSLTSFRGMQVFETRTFDVAEDVPPIDLLRQNRCVGEYYVMRDEYKDQAVEGYNSCHRDIVIYNEATDNWQKIGLKQAIDYSGVFKRNGDLGMDDLGDDDLPGMFRLDGDDRRDGSAKYPGTNPGMNGMGSKKVKLFGDIHPHYLKTYSVKRVAASGANAFAGRTDLMHVPQELTSLWSQINEAVPTDPTYARYLSRSFEPFIKAVGADDMFIRGDTVRLFAPRNTGPQLALEAFGTAADPKKYNFTVPIGFGSYAGMKQLATHAGVSNSPFKALAEKTNDLLTKFSVVHNHVRRAFPKSHLFHDTYDQVGSGFYWLPREEGATLFDNCVASVGDPLWLDNKIYGLMDYPTSGQAHQLWKNATQNGDVYNGTPFCMHLRDGQVPNATVQQKIAACDAFAALQILEATDGVEVRYPSDFPDVLKTLPDTVKAAINEPWTMKLLHSNHYHTLETFNFDAELGATDKSGPEMPINIEPEYPYLPASLLEGKSTNATYDGMGKDMQLCMPLCATQGMWQNMLRGRAHVMHPFRFGTPVQSVGMEPPMMDPRRQLNNEIAAGRSLSKDHRGGASRSQVDRDKGFHSDAATFDPQFVLTGSRLTHPETFGDMTLPTSTGGHNRLGNTSLALSATEWTQMGDEQDEEAIRAAKRRSVQVEQDHFDAEAAADDFFGVGVQPAGGAGEGNRLERSAADDGLTESLREHAKRLFAQTNHFHRHAIFSELGISQRDNDERGYGTIGSQELNGSGGGNDRTPHLTLHERWVLACAEPNDVHSIYHKAFLLTPVHKESLNSMIMENVVVPFNFVLTRPFIQHEMASVIMTVSGQDTGATFFGHSDFQLGDDVTSKVHYGNFTFYSKALVTNPKNVHILDGVYAQNYVKGNDCQFFDPTYKDIEAQGGFDPERPDQYQCSIFSMIIPYEEGENMPNPIDLSGSYNKHVYQSDSMSKEVIGNDFFLSKDLQEAERRGMFSTLDYYKGVWQFGKNQGTPGFSHPGTFQAGMRARANTVCFQGHQFSWCRTGSGIDGSGGYTNVTANTGHFGPDVYPGCGMVRRGQAKVLEKQGWNRCSAPV